MIERDLNIAIATLRDESLPLLRITTFGLFLLKDFENIPSEELKLVILYSIFFDSNCLLSSEVKAPLVLEVSLQSIKTGCEATKRFIKLPTSSRFILFSG